MFQIFFKKRIYFYKFFTDAEVTVDTHVYCKKSVRKLKILKKKSKTMTVTLSHRQKHS